MKASDFNTVVGIKDICSFLGISRYKLQKCRKDKYGPAFSKVDGRVVLEAKKYFELIGIEI